VEEGRRKKEIDKLLCNISLRTIQFNGIYYYLLALFLWRNVNDGKIIILGKTNSRCSFKKYFRIFKM
jgi:hypothetical protein